MNKRKKNKKKIRLNRPYFFIFTFMFLLLSKLLLMCTLFRSLGVSISSSSSDVQSKSTHSFLITSILGSRVPSSYLLIASCVNPNILANCACDIFSFSLFIRIILPNTKKLYHIVIFS